MKVMLEPDAHKPTRAHSTDAGLDLYAAEDAYIAAHGFQWIRTGVHVQLPHNTYGKIATRSSWLMQGLITDGTIDEGFTGEIKVSILNMNAAPKVVKKGERIAQLVVCPVLYESVEIVDELDASERGDCGYGSTGK